MDNPGKFSGERKFFRDKSILYLKYYLIFENLMELGLLTVKTSRTHSTDHRESRQRCTWYIKYTDLRTVKKFHLVKSPGSDGITPAYVYDYLMFCFTGRYTKLSLFSRQAKHLTLKLMILACHPFLIFP